MAAPRVAAVATPLTLVVLFPATADASEGVDDWVHIWEVVRLAEFRQAQPDLPSGAMVYYLGDSTARESTVSDVVWTRQLQRRAAAAGRVRAYGYAVAGHNQTFGMDETVVDGLPATPERQPRGIVLIGVGISRFISPPKPQAPAQLVPVAPGVEPPLSAWAQHHYYGRPPLPLSRKHELVPRWVERRWPGFKASRYRNFRAVGRLIVACKAKGLRPVLVDLPLDLRVAGSGLAEPPRIIRDGSARLARRHGIKYLRFNRSLGLPSSAFWDLHHLLRPGSTRWQARLSAELVRMLPRVQPSAVPAPAP